MTGCAWWGTGVGGMVAGLQERWDAARSVRPASANEFGKPDGTVTARSTVLNTEAAPS
jgi:hypothetical protein